MKITKRQLRRIIKESLLNEILPGGEVPRSVQADYDIVNKEDTFPKLKPEPDFIPREADTRQAAVMIRDEINKVLSRMPGFEITMEGEGSGVDVNPNEVMSALSPVIGKMGLTVEDHGNETIIYYDPAGVEISVFSDYTGNTTEFDFGDL